jgi:hypothetical protein
LSRDGGAGGAVDMAVRPAMHKVLAPISAMPKHAV